MPTSVPLVLVQIGGKGKGKQGDHPAKAGLPGAPKGPPPKNPGMKCPWHQTPFNNGQRCGFGDKCSFSHDMRKGQAEFDAMQKPPAYKPHGRSPSPSPRGPPKPKQTNINFGTFCKKGLDCTGRPSYMGGDGTCACPFHVHANQLAQVEEIKARNKAASKAAATP